MIRSVCLALILMATAAVAQDSPPEMSAEDAESFLSEFLMEDLHFGSSQIRIEDETVFIALNIAEATPEEITPGLILIFMAAQSAATGAESVRIIPYHETVPLFVVSATTEDIAAFAASEMDDIAFTESWQFEGVE